MKNIKEYNFNGMTVPFIINDYYESETKWGILLTYELLDGNGKVWEYKTTKSVGECGDFINLKKIEMIIKE
jgi:hypothetical protein